MAGLLRALDEGADYSFIRMMVRNFPSDIIKSDRNGMTALHKAVKRGSLPVVNLLLAWGADPNAKNRLGYAPLHYAVGAGNYDVARTLLYENSWVDPKAEDGKTPLHILARKKCPDCQRIAELLVKFGANIYAKDNLGQTPFDIALKAENSAFSDFLSKL